MGREEGREGGREGGREAGRQAGRQAGRGGGSDSEERRRRVREKGLRKATRGKGTCHMSHVHAALPFACTCALKNALIEP